MPLDQLMTAKIEAANQSEMWGTWILFLDTINSIEELDVVLGYVREYHPKRDDYLFEFYRNNLTLWPVPLLPDGFKDEYPFITMKLGDSKGLRVYLRGCKFMGADPWVVGKVMEPIVADPDRKVLRHRSIWGPCPTAVCGNNQSAIMTALCAQAHLETWTLSQILIPTACCVVSDDKLIWVRREWEYRFYPSSRAYDEILTSNI